MFKYSDHFNLEEEKEKVLAALESGRGVKFIMFLEGSLPLLLDREPINGLRVTEETFNTIKDTFFKASCFKELYNNSNDAFSMDREYHNTHLICFLEGEQLRTIIPRDIDYFLPKIDTESTDFVYITPDANHHRSGKRVKMKPGKAFRKMFPYLTDPQLESLVEKFKQQFAPREFELFFTKCPDEIEEVYTGTTIKERAISTTTRRKRLSDSCMRHPTSDLYTDLHPVRAYGSGDFTLYYLKEKGTDLIAARSLVRDSNKTYAPVYGSCESSVDRLYSELEELGCKDSNFGSWFGAKLLSNKTPDGYALPYLDLGGNCEDTGDGYVVICADGSLEPKYDNYAQSTTCDGCGCILHQDDLYTDDFDTFCESCYYERFAVCYESNLIHPTEEMVTVTNKYNEEVLVWGQNLAFYAQCSVSGELFHLDLCTYLGTGDIVGPNEEIFQCEYDEEFYLLKDKTEYEGVELYFGNLISYKDAA